MKLFQKAIELAKKYHSGQVDKMGKPYINHVLAVVDGVKQYGESAMCVAALHDILEDTPIKLEELIQTFPNDIVVAVKIISKHPSIDDDTYYRMVRGNKLARLVKISDLKHNSDLSRIPKPTERDLARTGRYQNRLSQLKETSTFCEFIFKRKSVFQEMFDLTEDIDTILGMDLVEKSAADIDVQPWGNPKNIESEDEVIKIYNQAYQVAVAAKNDFSRFLKYVSNQNDKLLVAVKSQASFLDKVMKRGKSANGIHDVLRAAILAPDEERVDEIVAAIKKKARIFEYEYKKFNSDKKYGYYGSHHFKIQVGQMIAEVQVMTKKLWTYKGEAHDIYKVLRSDGDVMSDSEIKSMLQRSKELFLRGNRFSV